MKTKNLTLAIVAFALAISSAFASVILIQGDVFEDFVIDQVEDPECQEITVDCALTGGTTCEISVFDVSLNANKTVTVYRQGTQCLTELKDSQTDPIPTELEVE